jgi:hypothetical protein
MGTLSLNNVAETLAERVELSLDQLVTDPQRPDHGALIHPGWGLPSSGSNDVIRIDSGVFSHRTWEMRDSETAPDCARVLLTFHAPFDHRLSLHLAHGPYEVRSV